MTNLKDKGMGMALRNFYPKAFVLHQDVMFRVNGPGQALPGITKDEKESLKIMNKLSGENGLMEKIWEKILYELGVHGFQTDPIRTAMEFVEEEGLPWINVIVPSKIDLRLDKGLNVGRCEKCGHLHYLNFMLRNSQGLPIHRNCRKGSNSRYRQAPVFVPYPSDPLQAAMPHSSDQLKIQTVLPTDVNCAYFRAGGICKHGSGDGRCSPNMEEQHSYMMLGPNYPLKGIKIVNYNCPKGLKDIKPRPMTPHRAGSGFYYSKRWPDSGITQRLYTTVALEDERQSEAIDSINHQIQEIKKTWFKNDLIDFAGTRFSRISVIDLVYGLKVGGYYDHWLRGAGENNVMGRMLDTQGFVISIKENIWDVAEKLNHFPSKETDPVEDRVRTIVHTLKHAILNQIPTYTGVEETRFGGSYEILGSGRGAKIYLFDNEVGGHGGFATLMRDAGRFSRMIETVYSQTNCPIRNCRWACKHCLFLRNCGLGNNKLNRNMLLESGILKQQVE